MPQVLTIPTNFEHTAVNLETQKVEDNETLERYKKFKKILEEINDYFKKLKISKLNTNYNQIRSFIELIDKHLDQTFDLDFIMLVIVLSLYKNFICDSQVQRHYVSFKYIFLLVTENEPNLPLYTIFTNSQYNYFITKLQDLLSYIPYSNFKTNQSVIEYIESGDPSNTLCNDPNGDFIIEKILKPSIAAIINSIDPVKRVASNVLPNLTKYTLEIPTELGDRLSTQTMGDMSSLRLFADRLPIQTMGDKPSVRLSAEQSTQPMEDMPTVISAPVIVQADHQDTPEEIYSKFLKFSKVFYNLMAFTYSIINDYIQNKTLTINHNLAKNHFMILDFFREISNYFKIIADYSKIDYYMSLIISCLFKNLFYDSYILDDHIPKTFSKFVEYFHNYASTDRVHSTTLIFPTMVYEIIFRKLIELINIEDKQKFDPNDDFDLQEIELKELCQIASDTNFTLEKFPLLAELTCNIESQNDSGNFLINDLKSVIEFLSKNIVYSDVLAPTSSIVSDIVEAELLEKYNKFITILFSPPQGLIFYINSILQQPSRPICSNVNLLKNYKIIIQFIDEINKILKKNIPLSRDVFATCWFDLQKYMNIIVLSLYKNLLFDSYQNSDESLTSNNLLSLLQKLRENSTLSLYCDELYFSSLVYEKITNILSKLRKMTDYFNYDDGTGIVKELDGKAIVELLANTHKDNGTFKINELIKELNKLFLYNLIEHFKSSNP